MKIMVLFITAEYTVLIYPYKMSKNPTIIPSLKKGHAMGQAVSSQFPNAVAGFL
jgi:hypothetical protein